MHLNFLKICEIVHCLTTVRSSEISRNKVVVPEGAAGLISDHFC